MKPTLKMVLTVSALFSINALAMLENVTTTNETAASATREPRVPMSKPRPEGQQAPLVPQQGGTGYRMMPLQNRPGFRKPPVLKNPQVTQQSGYGIKPRFVNYSKPQPTNNTQVNPLYVGSSTLERSHLPQETHPMNVLHTSDDN